MLEITPEIKKRKLTAKQRLFVDKYLECRNAAQAAREAGYKGRSDTVGAQLKKLSHVAEAIQARLDELKLDADTVLALLSDQAKANLSMFLEFDSNGKPTGNLNWEKVRGPEGKLIKELKFTKDGPEIKLHDSQNALIWMGKNHALWTDKLDLQAQTYLKGYESVSPDDWDDPNGEN